ncbi:MAG: hypothetical protein ABI416_12795, partial [Ginsengibacter sp.]
SNEIRIEIKDAGKAKIYRKHAYTILNEAGDRYSFFYTHYDKFNDINEVRTRAGVLPLHFTFTPSGDYFETAMAN